MKSIVISLNDHSKIEKIISISQKPKTLIKKIVDLFKNNFYVLIKKSILYNEKSILSFNHYYSILDRL